MKKPLISPACWRPPKDRLLTKILRRCGAYYHSADLFYHELWKQRLANIGLRVLSIERLPYHPVWDIRLRCTLSAQMYLLVSKPTPPKLAKSKDLLSKQLESEIHNMAKDMGLAIKKDCLTVIRTGAYFQASFIWPRGKPGLWFKEDKKPEAFSFLIRPWLRKNRN
jgi:hypothetical protein